MAPIKINIKLEYKNDFWLVLCSRWAISSKCLAISACNLSCCSSFSLSSLPLSKLKIILWILARMVNLGEFRIDTRNKLNAIISTGRKDHSTFFYHQYLKNLHQDMNRVSSFIRCLNGTFSWMNCSIKILVH